MSITEQGRIAENAARVFLQQHMDMDVLMQADWLFKKDGEWFVVEVKAKSKMCRGADIVGHGLNLRQIRDRLEFYRDTGIRCLLLVFDGDKDIYFQWLDLLEQGKYFDLPHTTIRVYDKESFIHVTR